MFRKELRRISLDGDSYVWWRGNRIVRSENSRKYVWTLTVYLEGRKCCPLRISFPESANRWAGYPQAGVLWYTDRPADFNLNRPGVAAAIVRYMRQHGWDPESARSPLEIADGWFLFDVADIPSGWVREDDPGHRG